MKPRNPVRLCRFSLWLGLLISFVFTASSQATHRETKPETTDAFRWIHPSSAPQLWQQIESAFQDELAPDDARPGQDKLDVYRYKYLQKVGILNHSALVIVGRRPAKEMTKENAWDEYYSAFNFDLATKQKSAIEHADVMWKWKFQKLAKFGPSPVPDVTFTYLTCTECEPEVMFASLYYEETKSTWQVRSWGDGKDLWWTVNDGLIVDFENIGSGDTISFDCVYGILDLRGTGFDDVVIRCKEVSYNDAGRAKIDDSTVLYSSSGGQFNSLRVTNESEAVELTAKICRPNSASILCRLPAYMTVTSGQSAVLDVMFPGAPKRFAI